MLLFLANQDPVTDTGNSSNPW